LVFLSFYILKQQRRRLKMMDRSMNIMLMVVFGILGTAVLVLAWLQPMSGAERGLSTFMGVVGLGVSLSRIPALRAAESSKAAPVPVPAEAKK
jgi:hypothetical protein